MNQLFGTIAQVALNVLLAQLGGKPANIATAALEIISAARRAYEAETGLPLDVTKIKPYEPMV